MELADAIRARYSERRYSKQEPSSVSIHQLIKSAQEAPNSCNLQAMHFIVVDDQRLQQKLASVATRKVLWAPVNILFLHDSRFTIHRHSGVMSLGASMQNMCLTATDMGLATCPMAGFENDAKIKELLQIPLHFDLLLIMGVGYAASPNTHIRTRVLPDDLISYNTFDATKPVLNASTALEDWNMTQLTDYRRRIGPVYRYGERFSLSNFAEKIYSEIATRVNDSVIHEGDTILDIFSYDGVFARELSAMAPGYSISIADTVKSLQKVNAKIAPNIVAVDMSINYHIDAPDNYYNVVTCIHKLQFTPDRQALLAECARVLKPGGKLVVSFDQESVLKRVIEWLRNHVWYKTKGKIRNVYENNKNYKIGPKKQLSMRVVKKQTQECGLSLQYNEIYTRDVGARINHTYHYAVFEK